MALGCSAVCMMPQRVQKQNMMICLVFTFNLVGHKLLAEFCDALKNHL